MYFFRMRNRWQRLRSHSENTHVHRARVRNTLRNPPGTPNAHPDTNVAEKTSTCTIGCHVKSVAIPLDIYTKKLATLPTYIYIAPSTDECHALSGALLNSWRRLSYTLYISGSSAATRCQRCLHVTTKYCFVVYMSITDWLEL